MSVLAPHWHKGGKRSFQEDPQTEKETSENGGSKNRRISGGLTAPGSRCQPLGERQAYTVGAQTVAALHALFPNMNDQVITEVLQVYGTDIDAAIKRLGEMQISADKEVDPKQSLTFRLSPARSTPGRVANGAPAMLSATGSSPRPTSSARSASESESGGGTAPAAAAEQPHSPEEWVEALVQSMAQAQDVRDAHQRAATALHAFQEAVVATSTAQAVETSAAMSQQLADLQRDNSILKRAVTIQNSRLQEGAARDGELRALRAQLKQAAERVSALELSNYSLQQHLRAATGPQYGFGGPQRNPDVC